MTRRALPSISTKITIAFTFLGLTAWYLTGGFTDSDALDFVALFGGGIVLPTLIDEWRRRGAFA
ncbi:MAG: hypothetical protein ACQETI_06980 [Halobacteriota archaeon]